MGEFLRIWIGIQPSISSHVISDFCHEMKMTGDKRVDPKKMDDFTLLNEYVQRGSTGSLDQLVRRHLPMVHAAALRQVRDPHVAEDVTQAVFLELMRSSRRLSQRVVLAGWLFNTTRYIAFKSMRSQWRRRRHEQQAAALKDSTIDANEPRAREQLTPLLDDALAKLSQRERDAIVLRYLEGKSCREVGEAQHISEEAARQRVFRALARLRERLQHSGLPISEDVLGASLGVLGAHGPPCDLAARVMNALRSPIAIGASTGIFNVISRTLF